MADRRQRIAAQIAALRIRFLGSLASRFAEIERTALLLLDEAADERAMRDAAHDLHSLAHKLNGAAGSFRLDELSRLASDLEAAAMPLADRLPSAAERHLIAERIRAIGACIARLD